MAKSSIHFSSGKWGYLAHNSREAPTANAIFNDEKNYCSCGSARAIALLKNIIAERSAKYTERTKQKIQAKTKTHLSAILNFNKEHTPEDIKKVCEYLEKKFDTKVVQFAMHRDEGHISEDGEVIKNYHAHIEMCGLDSNGYSIKFTKTDLRNIQTDVANILGMERGKENSKAKRLDTYEYKHHKKEESKTVLAKQKDLKEEIRRLKDLLKESGTAKRSDYAELEQLNKDLLERIKNKDLELQELANSINFIAEKFGIETLNKNLNETLVKSINKVMQIDRERKENYRKLEHKCNELERDNEKIPVLFQQNQELKKKIEKIEESEHSPLNSKKENEELQNKLRLSQIEVNYLKKQNENFSVQIDDLKEKMSLRANSDDLNDIWEENQILKEENINLKKENASLKEQIQDLYYRGIHKIKDFLSLINYARPKSILELEQKERETNTDEWLTVSARMKYKLDEQEQANYMQQQQQQNTLRNP